MKVLAWQMHANVMGKMGFHVSMSGALEDPTASPRSASPRSWSTRRQFLAGVASGCATGFALQTWPARADDPPANAASDPPSAAPATPPKKPDWGYGPENGPDHWAELSDDFKLCQPGLSGQSPVPLSAARAVTVTLDELRPVLSSVPSKYFVRRKKDRGTFRFEPALRAPCHPVVGDAPPVDPWYVAAYPPPC